MTAISPGTNFFPTPAPFTRWLFREYPEPLQGVIVEPMAGALDIVEASRLPGVILPARTWVTSDLDPQWTECTYLADARDPALYELVRQEHGGIQAIVTNPAFDVADEFAAVAVERAPFVALYLRLSFLEPTKRGPKAAWLRDHPPTDVLVLPRFSHRRNEAGKWGSDSVTCAWMVWRTERRQYDEPARGLVFPPDTLFSEIKLATPAYRKRVDQLTGYSPIAAAAAEANNAEEATDGAITE